ncbi:MAG TPA: single-stranded DNA-binding protein [Solirubrobacteraceae bacterium]|nr:single-stranded DNA-binding protein [Solirubrobacteraceae bacterium]
MAGSNINRVIITGNLTRDPEHRTVASSGTSVCSLRVACNGRRKNAETGQWEDQPNYFDVTVWGAQADNCARFLRKGRAVAIDGRLQWREWTDQQGNRRQSVDIIAETVQFLGGRDEAPNGGYAAGGGRAAQSDVPIDTADFEPASVGAAAGEDDIPF